jgi:hypothetical protein
MRKVRRRIRRALRKRVHRLARRVVRHRDRRTNRKASALRTAYAAPVTVRPKTAKTTATAQTVKRTKDGKFNGSKGGKLTPEQRKAAADLRALAAGNRRADRLTRHVAAVEKRSRKGRAA